MTFVIDAALLAGALSIPGGIAVGAVRTTTEPVAGSIHVVDVEPSSSRNSGPPALPGPGPTQGAGPVLGQAQQRLLVEIRPGGPLRVTPSWIAVVVHREGDHMEGHLGPVQLVDPRGTLVGWHVVASVAGPRDEGAFIVPGQPTAVSGRQSEVKAGRMVPIRGDGPAVLMSAAPGGGGGTFTVSPTIVVRDRDYRAMQTVFVAISAY